MKAFLLTILTLSLLCLGLACGDDDNGTGSSGDTIVDSHPDPTKNISLAGVTGLSGGKIPNGQTITLSLKVLNDYGVSIQGMTNGFRIYSPDGAQWASSAIDTTGTLGKDLLDGGVFLDNSTDGVVADTVGVGGFKMFGAGVPDGFDEVAWTIAIGPINSSYAGKHICLDSSWYDPSGVWLWATSGPSSAPSWDGPHCWEISN